MSFRDPLAADADPSPGEPAPTAYDLAQRPGFLIRRLHQIHVALFIEECAAFEVTPVQYSVMTAAQANPGLDQARLGEEIGVDRATLANVVGRLDRRGLLQRRSSPADRRLRLVELTEAGSVLLAEMEAPARRAHARTIAALPPAEREVFVRALADLVQDGNARGRAPLRLG